MSRATEDTGSVAQTEIAGELMRSPASRYEGAFRTLAARAGRCLVGND